MLNDTLIERATNMLTALLAIRDGVVLDYPFTQAIESFAPLCEKIIVNEGYSLDNTWEVLLSLKDVYKDKLVLTRNKWEFTSGVHRRIYMQNYSMVKTPWVLFAAGDEAFHPKDYDRILGTLRNRKVNYINFNWLHLYYHPDRVYAKNFIVPRIGRTPHYDVRQIECEQDCPCWKGENATGSTKNGGVILRDAHVFHYGLCRDPIAYAKKQIRADSVYDSTGNFPYADGSLPDVKTISIPDNVFHMPQLTIQHPRCMWEWLTKQYARFPSSLQ